MCVFSEPWFPDEINSGYVERFMFLMAGLLVLNLFAFLPVAKFYKSSKHGMTYLPTDDFLYDVPKLGVYETVGGTEFTRKRNPTGRENGSGGMETMRRGEEDIFM